MDKDSRVEQLLEASIQIADHMHESGIAATGVAQIKKLLQEQLLKMEHGGTAALESDSKFLRLEQIMEGLIRSTREEYLEETAHAPNVYEAKPIKEQMLQEQAYHEKIDYLSLYKIKENIEQMRNLHGK